MRALGIFLVTSFIFAVGGIMMFMNGKVEVEPTRILNPTNFEKPEQIGAIVFRRFWQEIRDGKLVILGSSPFLKNYDSVWGGFLSVAKNEGVKFSQVFSQAGLRPITQTDQPLDWEKVQLALVGEGRVLVQVASTDQMLEESNGRTLAGLILFQDLLPVTDSEKQILANRCTTEKIKTTACIAKESLSHGKRKRYDPKQLTSVIEKHGERFHLLLIHEP
jgi:hypothetical protein